MLSSILLYISYNDQTVSKKSATSYISSYTVRVSAASHTTTYKYSMLTMSHGNYAYSTIRSAQYDDLQYGYNNYQYIQGKKTINYASSRNNGNLDYYTSFVSSKQFDQNIYRTETYYNTKYIW